MPALRKTVLLVENEETIRELIGLHLLRAGYAVRAVPDGVEAMRACLKSIPDLVISDVHMPHMGGFEFVASLRANHSTRDVPVIFLTVDDSGAARGAELGAVAFLTKPILADKLLETVARCLASSAQVKNKPGA